MPATGFLEATLCLPAYINLLALCLVQEVQVRDDSVTCYILAHAALSLGLDLARANPSLHARKDEWGKEFI